MSEKIRINKYLSASGVMSRRRADSFIMSGRISVNGSPAVPGMMVDGSEEIRIDGKLLDRNPDSDRKVVLLYNKKKGTVTSTVNQGKEKNSITDAVDYPVRVYPIGRLDKDSEGLILLTNDGSLVNRLLKSGAGVEKEYEVSLDKEIESRDISKMEKGGLELTPGRKNKPCKIFKKGPCKVNIILTEGINREIRRIMEYYGYRVMKLKRIRFGKLLLGDTKPGEYRELSPREIRSLLS
ncbi:MAG: rRNA pseudouridine synthase [Lachnospiraceae bacterium]|nr:rRNA pseudouridine synthase [Lachnospiraceae bacterium]